MRNGYSTNMDPLLVSASTASKIQSYAKLLRKAVPRICMRLVPFSLSDERMWPTFKDSIFSPFRIPSGES